MEIRLKSKLNPRQRVIIPHNFVGGSMTMSLHKYGRADVIDFFKSRINFHENNNIINMDMDDIINYINDLEQELLDEKIVNENRRASYQEARSIISRMF